MKTTKLWASGLLVLASNLPTCLTNAQATETPVKRLLSISIESSRSYDSGIMNIEYDGQGRVSSISSTFDNRNDLCTFAYSDNQIDMTHSDASDYYNNTDYFHFFLDNGKIASSSVVYEKDHVQLDDSYTYDSEGHLIQIDETITFLNYNNTKTESSLLEWSGDDLIKLSNGRDLFSTYTNGDLYSYPVLHTLFSGFFGFASQLDEVKMEEAVALYPYFGTLPSHLYSNGLFEDNDDEKPFKRDYDYTYETNDEGDVIRVVENSNKGTYVFTLEWSEPIDDIITGISTIHCKDETDVFYTLGGQRVLTPNAKGIYIHCGKKYFQK